MATKRLHAVNVLAYLVVIVLALTSALFLRIAEPIAAVTSSNCGSDVFIIHPPDDDKLVLSGIVPVDVYVKPLINNTPVNTSKVQVFVGNNLVGNAQPVTSGSNEWHLEWNSETLSDTTAAQMYVKIFEGTNPICSTDPITFQLLNTTQQQPTTSGEFILKRKEPTLAKWVGTTQISKDFVVEAIYRNTANNTITNIASDTYFKWYLTPNSVGSLGGDIHSKSARFFSGGQPGTANLILDATYQGQTRSIQYEIVVESQSTSNYPAIDKEDIKIDDSTETEDDDFKQISSEDLNEVLTSDSKLTSCLIDVVGKKAYQEIVDGKRRLSFSELAEAERCFTATRFLLPANVAPINPAEIESVRRDPEKAVITQADQASDIGLEREGIVFRGTSLPDRNVVIYIFSEPLVLTTSTNSEGQWTYVLEDPLEAGEHTAYVAVEDDEGNIVRSEAFSFNVAEAASIETNPRGLSLQLDLSDPQQSSLIYFVSAGAAIILFAAGMYVFIIRRKPSLTATNTEKTDLDNKKSSES